MNSFVFYFIICILNMFLAYFISDFLKLSFDKKSNTIYSNICHLGFYLIATLISIVNLTFISEFMLYWGGIFVLTLLYRTTFRKRIFVSLISLIIIESIELLTKIVFAVFLDATLEQLLQDKIIILAIYAIARLFPFIVIQAYKRIFAANMLSKNEKDYISSIKHIVFMLIPLLSISSIIALASLENELGRKGTLTVAITIGMILAINILYFYIYNIVIDRYEKLAENLMLSKQIEYHSNQYLQIENSLNETKTIKHDLKYHLLDTLQKNEIDTIKKDLNDLICEIGITEYTLYTDNHTIDTMLNFIKSKAENLGIQMIINTNILAEIIVDSKLLCSILGNAFENAIEGSLSSDKKLIKVDIALENNSIYIAVKNSYKGDIVKNNNKILTSKSDKINHGFGLKSIYDSAYKLDGKVKITTENNTFTLEIVIFNT